MKEHVIAPKDLDMLAAKARTLLRRVGYLVQHDGVGSLLQKAGLKESPQGRFLFDDKMIDEFVAFQARRAAARTLSACATLRRRTSL